MVDVGSAFQKGICLGGASDWNCSLNWLIMVLLFFIAAVFRKQVANDLLGTEFSLTGAVVLSEFAFVLLYIIFGTTKWALLAGIIGLFIGGFMGSKFMPDGESDSDFGNMEA